jgi:hypothetical protein
MGLIPMQFLPRCVVASFLLFAALPISAQTRGQQHASPPPHETQRKPKPVQDEPALPNSPGATFTEQVKQGLKAEPECRGLYPCELTERQKFHMFVKRSYSPYTFAGAAFDAAYSQFTGEDYGEGIGGFGKRYGANLADGEARSFFQRYFYSSLFRQDPRYRRIDDGALMYRASYAASRVFIGRSDSGSSVFNFPELLGVATSSTLSNAYYPLRDRGVGRTVSRAFGDLLSDAGSNLLQEFWPDMRRMLRRHEPRAVKRLEEKVTAVNPARRRKEPAAEVDEQ